MLDCSVSSRLDLERRIGPQLDIATLGDLLIPSFRDVGDTLFDVDTLRRILVNFSQKNDSEEDMDDLLLSLKLLLHHPKQHCSNFLN